MTTSRTPSEPYVRATPPAQSILVTSMALVAGVLAVGIGAGLGIRHLQLEGASVISVLGLSVLAVGLLLVTASVRRIWRSVGRRSRFWFVPGVLVSLVLAWSLMIAVMVTVVPSTPLDRGRLDPAGAPYREVHATTDDGVTLAAWWAPSVNGAAIVLLHGAGENRSSTLRAASTLVRHGYGVLLLDARGHGDSAGAGMDLGWYGDSDVGAAIDFLRADSSVDASRIGLLGLSMGGEEAIGAAAANRGIHAVVAEGATSRTADDKAAWLPGGMAGGVQRVIDRVTYALVDVLTPAGPPITLREALTRATDTRVLLIAAGTSPDEQTAAAALRSAAPDRVSLWTVAGATHTGGLSAAPAQWENRVIGFLDDTLATS